MGYQIPEPNHVTSHLFNEQRGQIDANNIKINKNKKGI